MTTLNSVLCVDPYGVLTKEEIRGMGKAEMHFLTRSARVGLTDKHDERYLVNSRITHQ